MTAKPTATVDVERALRGCRTVTVNVKYVRVWRVRARLWIATQLIRLGTWVAQQEFKVNRETQP